MADIWRPGSFVTLGSKTFFIDFYKYSSLEIPSVGSFVLSHQILREFSIWRQGLATPYHLKGDLGKCRSWILFD